MNVEIGAEAALFPEKEYIKGIFVAVHDGNRLYTGWGVMYALVLLPGCLEWPNWLDPPPSPSLPPPPLPPTRPSRLVNPHSIWAVR